MSSAPVTCSLSVGALSCISVIAQSHIIDKVFLISCLYKVLRNSDFVMNLFFECATSSEPLLFKDPYLHVSLLFQKMLFSTSNPFVTVALFIDHLVVSHTNTVVFTLKLPWGAQSGCTTQIIFLLNTMNKSFASNLHFQGSI